MTEPTPEAQTTPVTPYDVLDATASAWFAMPQEERDACLVAISVATISTGDSAPMPPAAPQEAADGGATPSPAVDAVEPSADGDAPLFVGATDPMQQRCEAVVARLLALGFKEGEGCDTLRMFFGHSWAVPVPLPGHDAGPRKVEDMLDDAERLCRRMEKPEPTAPGPTLAEVQAELERERERADRAELDAVQERERADEAKAELAAIAALLDPEDAPAYDSDDQPIPLPVRVQTALMPDPIGKSELERRITKALDRYDAPKGFGSLGQASPYGRVLLTARENKQLKADKAALQGIINDTEWIVHHCGSYGATASLADRVLRLLPAERQRAVLELKRAEAYIDVARLQARFLNPPPPGRLDECTAKMAEIEAKIAALPSLPPSTTPLADDLRDLVGRIRCECHGEEAAAVCAELLTVAETLARMEVQ